MCETTNNSNNNEVKIYSNVEVQFPHLEYNKFKEKYVRQLKHIIALSRLNMDMRFNCYGNVETSEDGLKVTISETSKDFSRKDTYVLIYDIVANNVEYDKIFVLTQKIKDVQYIHYIVYNTKTGKSVSHFYKNYDLSSVYSTDLPNNTFLIDLNVTFNRLKSSKKLNELLYYKRHLFDYLIKDEEKQSEEEMQESISNTLERILNI